MPCLYHHRLVGAAQQPVGQAVVKDATVQNWVVSQVKWLPKIGGTWGGARFTGHAGALTQVNSYYWSSCEMCDVGARLLWFDALWAVPKNSAGKVDGFALRCVR